MAEPIDRERLKTFLIAWRNRLTDRQTPGSWHLSDEQFGQLLTINTVLDFVQAMPRLSQSTPPPAPPENTQIGKGVG